MSDMALPGSTPPVTQQSFAVCSTNPEITESTKADCTDPRAIITVVRDPNNSRGKRFDSNPDGIRSTTGRLTKQFLMAAPAGSHLVSNIYAISHVPIFAEGVAGSIEGRLKQWERIKTVEANGRLAHLYPSIDAYEQLSKLLNLIAYCGKP